MKYNNEDLTEKIYNLLRQQEEDEKDYWESLATPSYYKATFRFWWVAAPLFTIVIILFILTIAPSRSNYISLSKIDNQLDKVEFELDSMNDSFVTQPNPDLEIDKLENMIEELKEDSL